MRSFNWRRAAILTAMCSALALGACAPDVMTGSVPSDPGSTNQPLATAERMMRMGDSAMAAGDPATALGFYSRAVWLDSDNYPLMIRLGGALNGLNAYAHGAEAFRKALAVAPRDPEALRGLGNSLLAQNRPLLAREQYQTALETSNDPRLFGAVGVTLDMTADHEAAQGYYRRGLEKVPDDLTLRNNLALSLMLGHQFSDAIATQKGVIADPRSTMRHRQNLAMIYGLAGRTNDARRVAGMDYDAATVSANLAYYEVLRGLPDQAKYLLGPDRQRMAMVVPPETPTPAPHGHTEAPATKAGAGDTAEAAPLPAPDIDREAFAAAATPAALPPVGPMQLDVPVRAWNIPESELNAATTADAVDPAGPADLASPADPVSPAGTLDRAARPQPAAPAVEPDPAPVERPIVPAVAPPAAPEDFGPLPDDPTGVPNPMVVAGLVG